MPTPKTFCFEHLWRLNRIGVPVPSPQGDRLVVPVTSVSWPAEAKNGQAKGQDEREPGNEMRTDLWLVDAGAPERPPRRLTWDGGSDPAWSPCGSWIVFTRKRSIPSDEDAGKAKDELPKQLWRLPMEGPGEAERITSMPTAVSSPKVFPDGRYVAFVADTWPGIGADLETLKERVKEEKDDPVQARITDRRLVRYWDEYRTDGRVPHVFVVDLETREVRDLLAGLDGLLHFMDFRWDLHPEGSQIALARNATEPPWQGVRMEVALVDIDVEASFSAKEDSVVEPSAPFADDSTWDSGPTYLPDGRLVFFRNPRPECSADFSHLMVWDGTEVRELLPGWDGDPGAVEPRAGGDEVVFLAQERGHQRLFATSTRTPQSEPRRLDPWQDGSVVSARPLRDGRVACLRQGFHRPSELWLLGDPANQSSPRQLGAWNDELCQEIEFGSTEPEDVTFEVPVVGTDGSRSTQTQMFVLHPPDFDPSRRYPLLLLLHGGPHSAWLDSFHLRWNAALLAAGGRVVAALNPHGSTGFGQAYAEAIVGRHADQPYADAMAAVDLLLARGYVDPERLAVAGGSYGGYLTSWVLGHTDRFAAAICHAGVYDLMAQFASDYTWSRGNNYGSEPWQDPTLIDRQSPSRFAGAFTTPTLVIHGEKDYRVPVTQGLNLYQILQGKGVPSKLVIFPKENHWVLKPRAAQLWWREVDGWLDRWIGRGPSEA